MKLTPNHLDRWRLIPRLLVAAYVVVFWQTIQWFMSIPDPSMSQAAFVSSVIGAAAAFFGLYVNGKAVDKETKGNPNEKSN